MVRAIITTESEWDADQRAWMMALAEWRLSRCPHCGGDMGETTDSANEEAYRRLEPLQCFRCLEFARAEQEYREYPFSHTLMHRVELTRRR